MAKIKAIRGILLLVAVLSTLAQPALAEEKKTVKLSLSQTELTTGFLSIVAPPRLTIDAGGATDVQYQFTRKYNIVGSDGNIVAAQSYSGKRDYGYYANERHDSPDVTIDYSVDESTNVYVDENTGNAETMAATGTTRVRVTVTPTEEYADQYDASSYSIEYKITVGKQTPTFESFAITRDASTDFANYKYPEGDGVALQFTSTFHQQTQEPSFSFACKLFDGTGEEISSASPIHQSELQANSIIESALAADSWTVTSEAVGLTETDAAFTLSGNVATAANEGSGSIRFTLTPNESASGLFNAVDNTVKVQVVKAKGDKIAFHLQFYYDHSYDNAVAENTPWNSWAQKGGTFKVPVWPKDADGNDIHTRQFDENNELITRDEHFDQFVYSGQQFHPLKAKVVDDYGNDWSDKFNTGQQFWPQADPHVVISDTCTCSTTYIYSMENGMAGKVANPGNFLPAVLNKIVLKLKLKPITGYESLADSVVGTYSLAVLPRTPQVKLTPDPSTMVLPSDYVMSPSNRFNVEAFFVNLLSSDTTWMTYAAGTPTETHAHSLSNAFSYSVDVSDDEGENLVIETDEENIRHYERGGKNYTRYYTNNAWGNDNFSMKFKKPGTYKLVYTAIPYNSSTYLIGETHVFLFIVKEPLPVAVVVDPKAYVTYVNQNIEKPSVKVIRTDTGEDVSSHYTFTYVLQDRDDNWRSTGTTWKNPGENVRLSEGSWETYPSSTDDELQIGSSTGTVTVTVLAAAKADEDEAYVDCTGGYTVKVIDAPTTPLTWEVIKADSPASELMGKLHFTGAGQMAAGFQVAGGIPGLDVTFGSTGSEDFTGATATGQTESEGNTSTVKAQAKTYVSGGDVSLGEDGIPASGTFYVLRPYTNGFVSADAQWESGKSYILAGADGKTVETLTGDGTSSTRGFTTALCAGSTYYLYAASGALSLHGLAFDPVFLNIGSGTKATSVAVVGANNTTLPRLLTDANDNVSFTASPDGTITSWSEPGVPALQTMVENDLKATVAATVKSQYTADGISAGDIYKAPSYDLTIRAIPSYWVRENRYASNGLEVTTTNIPTNIRMFYGGWLEGDDRPYLENGATADNYDEWSVASAMSSADGIDGFQYATSVANVPRDERGYGLGQNERFSQYGLQAFNVPCRGSFVRFEPEENGTLIVYLQQQGLCPQGTTRSLRWNNVYITDEAGANVSLTDNIWGEGDASTPDGGLYSTGRVQATLNGFDNNGNAIMAVQSASQQDSYWDWSTEFALNGTEADKQLVLSAWQGKSLNDREQPVRLSDGGLAVVSTGYTRYTFPVLAGKTYFVSQREAELGFAGFSFVPDGFEAGTYSKDAAVSGHTDKTYDLRQGSGQGSSEVKNKDVPVVKDGKLCDGNGAEVDAAAYAYVDARLDRTFAKGKWAPLCLPFSVNETQFKRVFGDDALIITFDYIRPNSTAHYTQHAYHYIEAGRPYFVMPSKDVYDDGTTLASGTTTFSHVSLEGVEPITMSQKSPEAAPFNYDFAGFYDETTIPQYSYYMTTSNKIRKVEAEAGKPMKGFRAYLRFNDSDGAVSAAQARILDDGTATGITLIGVDERGDNGSLLPSDSNVYDISGRLISRKGVKAARLQRGVYISRGKKIVVK